MLKRLTVSAFVLMMWAVLGSGAAAAQSQMASEAKVRELIAVAKSDEHLKQIVPFISNQVMADLARRVPNVTPQVKANLTALMQKTMLDSSGVFVEAAIPIYQKYYTEEEVDGLIAFLKTPIGQAYVEKSPLVAIDMFKVGNQIGRILGEKAREAAVRMLRDKGYNL